MSPAQPTLSKAHLSVYVEKQRIFLIGQILESSLQLSFENSQRLLADDDDNDINLPLGGASGTDIPRPPKGYRDVLS
jgi:hypothetical protein